MPLTHQEAGLVSLQVGTPHKQTADEHVMISIWTDLDAMKHFTAVHWQRALVLPGDAGMVKESFVHHNELLESGLTRKH